MTAPPARRPERATAHSLQAAGTWAIVGMGPVGRRLADAIAAAGGSGRTYDVAPGRGGSLEAAASMGECVAEARRVILAVPAGASAAVATELEPVLPAGALCMDWSSSLPAAKVAVATRLGRERMVDVALLDSITELRPTVAVSGPRNEEAVAALEDLGFAARRGGGRVGDAAGIKLVRSMFMKPLEALLVEWLAVAARLDPNRIAVGSVERTLAQPFAELADMLVRTNRLHAARRTHELEDVIAGIGAGPARELLEAAREVLHGLAETWDRLDPPHDAPASELIDRLAGDASR